MSMMASRRQKQAKARKKLEEAQKKEDAELHARIQKPVVEKEFVDKKKKVK